MELGLEDGVVRHRVEVDQRALIDKILARYATDYGAVRELIQNADDAGATEAGLALDCEGSSDTVNSVTVWNNGRIFSDGDWTRLRKIAAGNPDEASVGLFGVGFFFDRCPWTRGAKGAAIRTGQSFSDAAGCFTASLRELPDGHHCMNGV